MLSKFLEAAGTWIQTLGTFINASGQTIIVLQNNENSFEGNALALTGNSVEAFGNSVQAIGKTKQEDSQVDGILGAWFQAGGNITNAKASYLMIRGFEEDGLRLDVIGDSIQSIGAFFEAASSSTDHSEFADLASKGQLLQSFGAMIEAIGVLYILNDEMEEGIQIQAFGSYAQLAGATITAIAFTKEWIHSEKKN
ncbi:DUF6944 family repetitive protein [Pseudalkalibacillus sp. SCS-8]|uniref:DUF6944 family repetitive protein n=1 Tax=Pseudalkalibacillus nanhaiensis TaxID=3115291 RepID=UPI0032DA732C